MYEPNQHIKAGQVIRLHSTNRTDIRKLVFDSLDLGHCRHLLDLGCGYGFTYEANPLLRPGTIVVGVDSNPHNRAPFEERVSLAGATPDFVCKPLPANLDYADGAFDVVLAFFSLYFFTDMLPEIRRLVADDGVFVAVTHCGDSFQEFNELVGDPRLFEILRNFEDRNGADLLSPYFRRVNQTRYLNDLVFGPENIQDLDCYLDFKRPLWLDERQAAAIKSKAAAQAADGGFRITKNDTIFWCRP